MRNALCLLIVVGVLGFSSLGFGAKYSADLFELNSNFTKKILKLDMTETSAEGSISITGVFSDLDGKPVFEEKSVLRDAEIVSDDIRQLQTGETARISVEGDTIYFSYEKDGKKKTAQEKLKKPFVTTANFTQFVAKNWSKTTTAEGMELRYGVWFRLDTVGFKIFKVDEKKVGAQTW
ncbi:MAG: hypothetical protein EOP09_13195, partial [Proteobacteria bacterium]